MSLLLDENLSPRLASRLNDLLPGLIHVREVGLKQASDDEIWMWGRENRHTVVTADSDFMNLVQRKGRRSKVIYLERCDFPLRVMEDLLRQNSIRISEFLREPYSDLLVLKRG